jgi:hypothetical protein
MLIARHEQSHRDPPLSKDRPPRELRRLGQRRERLPKPALVQVEIRQRPLDPHEKQPQLGVLVLVGVQDISPVREQKIGHHRYQALAIDRMQQQHSALVHASPLPLLGQTPPC